jgi:hypothetical protein
MVRLRPTLGNMRNHLIVGAIDSVLVIKRPSQADDGRFGSTAPRVSVAANHITTAVALKLPRKRRLSQEGATLIGLSKQETNHERINPVQQSSATSVSDKGKLIGAKPPP